MKKKLQVFVSSTYEDLKEERQAAVQAILNSGHIPAGMELFTAGDESQKDTIKKWIDESDVYFLILGGRYGTIDESTGKSYTHWEYEYAGEIGKPRFAVVIKEDALEDKIKINGTQVMEKHHPTLYQQFRDDVLTKVCKFYSDIRDIQIAIYQKLAEYSGREDLVGWVYGKDVPDDKSLSDENAKLRMENDKLKSEIDKLKEDKQETRSINGIGASELISILKSKVLKVPNSITKKGETEIDIFFLFITFKDNFATGVTNAYGSSDLESFLYFQLAPELMTFDLLEKVKVAGVKYEKIQTSKNGFKFLKLVEQDKFVQAVKKGKVKKES